MTEKKRALRFLTLCLTLSLVLGLAAPALAADLPSITAPAAIVIDYDTGEVLYEKNPDARRAPASMTKVMCAYIIFEELAAGNITYDTLWTVGQEAAACSVSGVSNAGPLYVGQQLTVDMALRLIFIPSACACCVLAAENISGGTAPFIQRMNETARRMGIDAYYVSTNGTIGGEQVSPRAQATLVRNFIMKYPDVLRYTSMTQVTFNGAVWSNCNKLLSTQYYEGCDGFKTGTMSAAGCCLSATAVRNGKRIISVVMGSISDYHRFTDSAALLDYGFAVAKPAEAYWDVPEDAWFAEPVLGLRELGAEMSLSGSSFLPDQDATRAQFVAMFLSALQAKGLVREELPAESGFTDCRGHWAEGYIALAAELGIVDGMGDGTFAPESGITREQMMQILYNAWRLPAGNAISAPDAGDVSAWAEEAVSACLQAQLVEGDPDGSIRPGDAILRSEMAALIWRSLNAGLNLR